ncbi:hypothetical protein CAOG_09019 [Capsaspora owczarzaki ATCC 30864]|uniref:hypothetical protein n=1 Tax=Capsaspora owczarzaki (strain ATCC 30864) TaxID=595528 RepID=UPI0003526FF2|nr:hypothetical protein CAOG_09019 [Capsaspora owczarzaki ATCC 30864]|eukprot:XP_011270706.1 hypothetical protein CAOG_09019 [Capsaspora owczarzaki ATCC 30864]
MSSAGSSSAKRQAADSPGGHDEKRVRTEDNDKSETTDDVAPMDTSNATSQQQQQQQPGSPPFNVKWTAPDLSNHLLKELFNYRVFIADEPGDDNNYKDDKATTRRVFARELGNVARAPVATIAERVKARKRTLTDQINANNGKDGKVDDLETTRTSLFLSWVQQWSMDQGMLKTTPSAIRDSLKGLITLERKQQSADVVDYPLVDLKLATASLTALLEHRLQKMNQSGTNRLAFRSFLASTLPGAGKTRLCAEFVDRIAPAVFAKRDIVPCCLSVTFNGDSGFTKNDWTITMKANPEHALSIRLLAAYFRIPANFFQQNFAQTGSFQVAATLQFIQESEYSARSGGRQPTSQDQLPWLAIAIDEINRLLVSLESDKNSDLSPAQQRRLLLKNTLSSLKEAVQSPQKRLCVLYAGTLPQHLTAGLTEPAITVPSNEADSSNLDVDTVPMQPFDGAHIAQFADAVVAAQQDQQPGSVHLTWRLMPALVSKLCASGGLPRHIEHVLGVRGNGAIARLRPSCRTLIELVHYCAIDASAVDRLNLTSQLLAWIGTGSAFVAWGEDNKGSLQFNLHGEMDLDQIQGEVHPVCRHLATTLVSFLNNIKQDMGNPPADSVLWERLLVHLFNVRVTACLAKALLPMPDAATETISVPVFIDVPLSRVLPGVTFGEQCAEVQLRLSPTSWTEQSCMTLPLSSTEPGIDSFVHVDVVQQAGTVHEKTRRAVIGLQMKLHMKLLPTSQATLESLETKARKQLEADYKLGDDVLVLVGVMSTARFANAIPPKHSWVLQRANLDTFAQGFQTAVKSAYSFDPHLSPATHIASSLYSCDSTENRPSQDVCMALAYLLVQSRHNKHFTQRQFRTAQDLRDFFLEQIGQSKTVSWSETKSARQHVLYAKDVPPVEVLRWYLALPDEQAASSSSVTLSA